MFFRKRGMPHRVIVSLCALLCVNATFAKRVFMLANKTPYLKISNSSVPEATAIGPSDFVVFNGLIAVLDSDNHAISFFKKNGDFVKRIELPAGGSVSSERLTASSWLRSMSVKSSSRACSCAAGSSTHTRASFAHIGR